MTVYDARRPRRLRPTLRLRLTLLNGILLVGAGAVLVVLAWTVLRDALHPSDQLSPGTQVILVGGHQMDARQWQLDVEHAAERQLLIKGLAALLVVGAAGVVGEYLVAGRALHQLTATARRLSGETLDQRINYDGADDEVAELAATFDAMLDRIGAAFDT